jgi:hypothetical protein
MAEQRSNGGGSAEAAARKAPEVVWDDSKLRSSYANVCNVSSTREEVVLLFGVNQSWQGGGGPVKVELQDRIILSPHAAKRMSLLLGAIVRQYEERFGKLDLGIPTPGQESSTS